MSNCICCANGNDLPEGEKCSACGRTGPAIHDHGLRLRDVTNAEVRAALKVPGVAQQPCNCGVMCQNLGKEAGCRYMQPARERLRTLVDIVWNDATDSSAVPSTKWADKLIDQVFGPDATQPPAAPVETDIPVAWLRDQEPEADYEALVMCNRIDPGAFPVYGSPPCRSSAETSGQED